MLLMDPRMPSRERVPTTNSGLLEARVYVHMPVSSIRGSDETVKGRRHRPANKGRARSGGTKRERETRRQDVGKEKERARGGGSDRERANERMRIVYKRERGRKRVGETQKRDRGRTSRRISGSRNAAVFAALCRSFCTSA